MVTANEVRGTGSHAAGNGGSSGIDRRSGRTAVILMPGQYRRRRTMRYCRAPRWFASARRHRRPAAPMADQPRQAAVVEFDHVTKRYDAPTGRDKGKGTPGAVNDLSMQVPAGK